MTTDQRLRELFAVIVEAVKNDSGLAERVGRALGIATTEPRKRLKGRNRRNPAPFDPFIDYAQGEEVLLARLRQLDIEALKDIVAQYGMDPSKLALRWKTPERLVSFILSTVRARSTRGDAFRRQSDAQSESP